MDILIVCVIILIALVMFATERVRVDLVSAGILAVLLVLGNYRDAFPNLEQCLSGFSNPATITIGAMFILSHGLVRTGAINWIVRGIIRLAGERGDRAMVLLLLSAGVLSAFINNTAAVAVFIPIALALSQRYRMSVSHVLMPLSYITIMGGMCTLIGTSTNLMSSSIAMKHGLTEIPMFEFAKLGLPLFVVGYAYVWFFAKRVLPTRGSISGLTRKYRLSDYLSGVVVLPESPLVGKTPAEAKLNSQYDVTILQILRGPERRWFGLRDTTLMANDRLLVRGNADEILRMREIGVANIAELKFADEDLSSEMTALAEGIVPPTSSLVGSTLKEADFRHKYGVFALAIRKHGRTIRHKIAEIRLDVGDTLLLQGRRALMDNLLDHQDLIMLREIDVPTIREARAWTSVGIVVGMVFLASFGILPIVIAAILGALAMVGSGCVTIKEAYESVDWMVIFLLVGVIPLGIALETTGAAERLVGGVVQFSEVFGPRALVSAFYVLTAALTAVMSNNATVILLAPLGIAAAAQLNVSPWPFTMAITFGASSAFSTPVGYQTNLMVYGPGRYRYTDFVRLGVPLTIVFWLIATLLIPEIWPLHP